MLNADMSRPLFDPLPDSPAMERQHEHFRSIVERAWTAEAMRREAIIEDFLISGAMPRDLAQVEAKLVMAALDLHSRPLAWRPQFPEWRLT